MKKIVLGLLICLLLVGGGAQAVWAGPPRSGSIIHVVQWGQTLIGIAGRYGTTVQAIMVANGLSNQNRIYAGQRLVIPVSPAPPAPAPGGCRYVVQYADTLTGIAYRHGVTVNALVRLNGIVNPNRIYPGQRLAIPCAPVPPPGPPSPPVPAPGGYYYVVRPGDTLARISLRFGVSIWTIVGANNIANPNLIYVGQRLYIPKGAPVPPPPPPPKPGCEHLTSPVRGAWLSGVVQAQGTADLSNFGYYKLEFRYDGLDEWHYITGAESPVQNGVLGEWDTRGVVDGPYIFRLVVVDNTGNYPPPCEIAVHVNNDP